MLITASDVISGGAAAERAAIVLIHHHGLFFIAGARVDILEALYRRFGIPAILLKQFCRVHVVVRVILLY